MTAAPSEQMFSTWMFGAPRIPRGRYAGELAVPVEPFVTWFDNLETAHAEALRREAIASGAELRDSTTTGALNRALADIGWLDEIGAGARRVHRWRHNEDVQQVDGVPVAPMNQIIDALDHHDIDICDVYDHKQYPWIGVPLEETVIEDHYCHKCKETVTTGEDGVCPWCETPCKTATVTLRDIA
jgi:hypothetical protein